MAAAIKSEFEADSELVPASGGLLEVSVNGDIAWTNDDNRGTIPTNEEVLEAVRSQGV